MKSLSIRLILGLALLALALPVFAAPSGPEMPWDQGLSNLVENLSGTVARLLILAAVVIAGLFWAFTEHNTGARKISQIVFGGAVALAAISFLAALGFSGAVV